MILPKRLFKKFTIAIVLFIIYLPGFVKIQKLNHYKKELERKIKLLKEENKQLSEEIYKLQHDPLYIEKVAREELKLGKEGEIIYKVPSEKK